MNVYIWMGGRLEGRVQACVDPVGITLGAPLSVSVWPHGRGHTQKLAHGFGVHTRSIHSPHQPRRPHGHALTPWQTPCPSPPRARHQTSQEATGNSDPPGLHKHGLETVPAEPMAGWGSTVANGVVGSPPYPAWLCPPDASALKFPAEFSILWRNRRIGRGGRCSEPKTQPLNGPPAPARHFLSCWKEPLCLVRVTSPVPSSRAFSLSLRPQVPPSAPVLTTQPHIPTHTKDRSKQGHAEASEGHKGECLGIFAE